jgi:O-antigen ligase
MKLLAYAGVFLLALELGRDRDRARMAFIAVCAASFGYALYGLAVHFTHAGTILWFAKDAYPDSVTATFVNRNAYATYAGMGVIAALAVMLSELRRLKRERSHDEDFLTKLSEHGSSAFYLAIAASLTGLTAVVLTGSRAGIACLVLGLLVFVTGMLVARDIRPRTFVIALALGGALLVASLWLGGGFLAHRLAGAGGPDARVALFDVARSAAGAHPWLGHGLGGFGPAFNLANDGRAVFDSYVDLAHNAYLELAVEGGIPAMLLSLALIGGGIGICFTGLLARGASTSIAAIAMAALVGTHAIVDFGIQMPAVAVTFMLLIGVAAAQALALDPATRGDALEALPRSEQKWRSPRRRRSGVDRPTSADEPVTPPAQPDMPWPVRASPVDRTLLATGSDISTSAPGPQEPVQGEVVPPPRPGAPTSDYQAALARWRTVRKPGAPAAPTAASSNTVVPFGPRDGETRSEDDDASDGAIRRKAQVIDIPPSSRS